MPGSGPGMTGGFVVRFNFQTARTFQFVEPSLRARHRHSGMVRRTRPGISRFRVRCFASPRNDGVWVASSPQRLQTQVHIRLRVPATRCARGLHLSLARGEYRMPRCTRGLVCNYSDRTHTSNNEHTGITRHSRTQWFYDLLRALPGDRALLPPSLREICLSRPVGAT
jgi:hypothetical protein